MCQKYTYEVVYYVSGVIEPNIKVDTLTFSEANRALQKALREADIGSVAVNSAVVDVTEGSVSVLGALTAKVKAYSEKEALSSTTASKLLSDTDFGELKNVRIYGKGAVRIDNKKVQVIGR